MSTSSVSRVLNGKPGVSERTREAVESALRTLGYSKAARYRASATVGLIVPSLANPIFSTFVHSLETELFQYGIGLLVCARAAGGPNEDEHIERLLALGVDGLIFIGGMHSDSTANPERYQQLSAKRIPYVLINGAEPQIQAPVVSADDHWTITISLTHLEQLGHTSIGFAVGPERYLPSSQKISAFMSLVSGNAQADSTGLVEHGLYTVQGGQMAANALLDAGHTGIVCASDIMAIGAIAAVRERGMSVPEDISVVGYDDSALMAYLNPPLTTVRQPVEEMASAAVALLRAEMDQATQERSEAFFRTELVVRGSTGRIPA